MGGSPVAGFGDFPRSDRGRHRFDLVVRPARLQVLAAQITDRVTAVRRSLGRLRGHTVAVVLCRADPRLRPGIREHQLQVLAGLARSVEALAAVAADLEEAAVDAAAADGSGAPPVCHLPEPLLSSVDRWLTDAVGDGLTGTAIRAVKVAGLLLPADRPTPSGDPGGRFSVRVTPLAVPRSGAVDTGPAAGAASLIAGALDATADPSVLANDEFGLIEHGGDRFTVVLPGVTDLTRPERGWNPVHRSARDLDMAALPSSRAVGVATNAYARSVAEALIAVGVPAGAELVIVGHSFGADTALDLVADPGFSDRYQVSHVVATGYFSQPQLESVPAQTAVLVVQNRRDAVVQLGSTMPTRHEGVLDCSATSSSTSKAVSVVRFDGGLGGMGHSVDGYRSVFNDPDVLDPHDAATLNDFVGSIDHRSYPAPPTMLAVDISLPEP